MSAQVAAHVVDALRELLPVPTGVTRDDSLTQPAAAIPNRLYAWPDRRGPAQTLEEADGRRDEAVLRVLVAISLPSLGESNTQAQRRATSLALDAWLAGIFAAVETNRRHALWWDLWIAGVRFDQWSTVTPPTARVHVVEIAVRLVDDPS